MLNLAEYRQRPALLADWLPWAGLIAPGVVLNKDGAFQRTARFRGPDLDSATQGELIATSARLNNALRRLGSGWALFIEAERRPAADYPHSDFPEALSWLVDEERRASFEESASHFESGYHLTLVYLPPEESRARAAKMLYENAPGDGVGWRGRLDAFVAETDRVFDLLDGVMPEIAWLDDSQTLTYLHATISTRRYRLAVPEVPFHIDALLADSPLVGGLAPMLGDQHLRVATVRGFPTATWPGMLDDLNRFGFAYRWSTRFLCLDKSEAEKELARLRRQWFAKRKNVIALLRETIFQQESPLVDTDASNKATDADAALQELGSDQVSFGYLTATVTVMDADAAVADEKLRMVERVIQGRGFVTIPENLNAVDAWLSSIPGNAYANVRQPIVSSLNLAHMMPVSAVWAGPERNDHLDGPPLIVTRTDGSTPFRLVTHIGDVGHTMIVGPTGMGKSVLVATLAMQFRRYPGARIFAFDVGRSLRAAVLGLGGEHYDLGADGEIAFQPLARIDREGYRTWAAEWIEGRLMHEGVAVGPDEKAAIWSALGSLAGAPVEQRTLTGFSVLLQSNAMRQALSPYVLGGAHGKLLDADHDRLGVADVQCFEMEELMMVLHLKVPKYQCRQCHRYFRHPFRGIRPRYRATESYRLEVFEAHEGGVSQKRLTKTHRIGSATVERWYQSYVRRRVSELAGRSCPQVLGIDEHFFTRKQGYATTLVDLKNHKVFDVVLGRSEASLRSYLKRLAGKQHVRVIVMDLSETYRRIARQYFPNALIVADRFHVVRLVNQHFLKLWQQYDPEGRKNRGLLSLMRRHHWKLTALQKERLHQYLRQTPVLQALYFAKQQLNGFLVMKSLKRKRARQILPQFLALLAQFEHSPARALAATLKSWLEPIVRMWRFTKSNGITEGFHTKMEMISRRAYGFRNFENYRLRVLALCGWDGVMHRV